MVDCSRLDLGKLLGGKHLLYPCIITFNKIGISLRVLFDIKANGFAFIDITFAINLAAYISAKLLKLREVLPVKGYNRSPGRLITYYIRLYIIIDSRKLQNFLFFITNFD